MSQYDFNDKIIITLPLEWIFQVKEFKASKDLEAMLLKELVGNLILYEQVLQEDYYEVKSKNPTLKTFQKKKKIEISKALEVV